MTHPIALWDHSNFQNFYCHILKNQNHNSKCSHIENFMIITTTNTNILNFPLNELDFVILKFGCSYKIESSQKFKIYTSKERANQKFLFFLSIQLLKNALQLSFARLWDLFHPFQKIFLVSLLKRIVPISFKPFTYW